MNQTPENNTSRREFLKTGTRIAAASALAGIVLPHVHAQDSQTIQVALVGCGGRGTGAAGNAMSVTEGPVKLVAMADVFENKLKSSHDTLNGKFKDQVEVPNDRKFIGFDGYKHAIDSLRPGDVAIFTTPLAFRWVHFKYAIEKKVNVFMEKPVTADGPTSRRMLDLAKQASAKNMKCGVGLMSRHARHLQDLHKRVQDGEIGDVMLMRGYRMHGPVASAFSTRWPGKPSELLWQISRFHSFLWASGGCFADFYIHHIDHLCWMKNAWPIKAQALGGRHYRTDSSGEAYVDQNFDSYAVEYTFADGAKFYMDGRCNSGAVPMYFSHVHGTKGMAIAARQGDYSGPSSIHKGQLPTRDSMLWQSKVAAKDNDPYLNEWNDLITAIRNDKPYNEVPFGVEASVVTSMGRKAAHTGQEVTYEDMLNDDMEYAPDADKWTMDSPPPIVADANGKYPVPMPGKTKKHEYEMNIRA
ncbi:MAG TPA: Gfo/Idh/MocA family oxidoreductase [Candidatus Acidoferrum sp.]|nr:Gfo/Idh/MocA family oxidoreductase [Candidatus Acidoferrum sp.]